MLPLLILFGVFMVIVCFNGLLQGGRFLFEEKALPKRGLGENEFSTPPCFRVITFHKIAVRRESTITGPRAVGNDGFPKSRIFSLKKLFLPLAANLVATNKVI
jgi:hypothetical protein